MLVVDISLLQLAREIAGVPLVNRVLEILLTLDRLGDEAAGYLDHEYLLGSVDRFVIVHDQRKCFCEHLAQRHDWNRVWLSSV
jgi:hypothetical protein